MVVKNSPGPCAVYHPQTLEDPWQWSGCGSGLESSLVLCLYHNRCNICWLTASALYQRNKWKVILGWEGKGISFWKREPAQAHILKTTDQEPEEECLLLLLSPFSRIRLCATPKTAPYQAPLSLGFSRQEYWSGLPFPSPMHESEKWQWSHSVMSDSWRPPGLQPTRLLRPWDLPGKRTGVRYHCLLQKRQLANLKI